MKLRISLIFFHCLVPDTGDWWYYAGSNCWNVELISLITYFCSSVDTLKKSLRFEIGRLIWALLPCEKKKKTATSITDS